jgi:hypothetical protein
MESHYRNYDIKHFIYKILDKIYIHPWKERKPNINSNPTNKQKTKTGNKINTIYFIHEFMIGLVFINYSLVLTKEK